MNFMFTSPTFVHFGCGISKQLGTMVKDTGAKRIFLVYDKGVKAAGLVGGIVETLKEAGLEIREYDGVLANPPEYQVHEGAELAKEFKADAIVAVGGGSSIDAAKAINILLTNPAPISLYDGINQVKNPVGPLFAIPTTSGTGSEVTVVSVVTDTKEKRKMVIFGQHVAPAVALVDPELTYGLPPAITASTGMDALTHAIESFVSTWASPVTDTLSLEAMRRILGSLVNAYRNGQDQQARTDMILGSLLAGMCFSSSNLGLVHSMAHPMSAHCNVPHGVANAIALPYVVEYNIPAIVPGKMVQMAQALGLSTDGKAHEAIGGEVAQLLLQLSEDLGIPRIRDVNVPKDLFPVMAKDAVHKELGTLSTPRKPTEEEVIALYEKAW
jgi:Alcohol dehydrogenase, class IV